ncbi:MAG: glycosyltransferase family 4 protein [Clostridium sp.]
MRKVLYITTVSRTINAFLIPHIEMLISKGYKVECACFIDKPIDRRILSKGVKVYEVPFSRNPFALSNYKAYRRLLDLQRINGYDIIHVHTPIASIYGRLLKLTFPNIKTIYTAHGYHFFNGASKLAWLIYYPIEKIMARYTDVTININREDYEITKKMLKPGKCYLVGGVGVNLEEYKKTTDVERVVKKCELGFDEEDFIVIMIAELNENKNVIQLIKALELLKDDYPKIKAISVGEGTKLEELKSEAENRGIDKNIKFLGFREDINDLINISDIGILLSYREGLPRSLMEIIANGRKVIATNIRGCKDIVWNENIGTLVNIGDYKETARSIKNYFLENNKNFQVPDEIKDYEVENIVKKLNGIYEELECDDNENIARNLVAFNRGI